MKSVYIQSDADGNSSFTLYRENYKYTEKTDDTDFEIWGTYRITDSNIVFVYKNPEVLPYNYLVEMEEIKMGGRVAGSCLTYYIDVLLEFNIDNQSNLMSFERNGRVFKKVQKH